MEPQETPKSIPLRPVGNLVRLTLQAEGAAIAALCVYAFLEVGGTWGLLALFILLPDLAMAGYLLGNRIGAAGYNAAHSYLAPMLLGVLGSAVDLASMIALALIWGAHIGMDRAIGYGLKYASGFRDTHLNRV